MIAIPELQNLDNGPNGTGKSLHQLKVYVDSEGFARDDDHNCNIPSIDVLTFGRGDWYQKEYGTWSAENVQHRVNYVLGFLRGVSVAAGPDEKTEVVLVTHGSFMNRLINNATGILVLRKHKSNATNFEIAHYSYAKLTSHVFDNDGALREIDEKELHGLRGLWKVNQINEEEEQTIKEQDNVEKVEAESEIKGGSDVEKDLKDSDSQNTSSTEE